MRKSIFLYCICIFSFLHISAKNPSIYYSTKLHFDYFSIAQGISQSNITCLLQDSRGFLWIGTQAGLNRYDGKSFEIFKHDPEDEESISDNMIYDISEDVEGNIWIATENGLNMFNRLHNNFTSYYPYQNNQSFTINDNVIYAVHADFENNIWIITPSYINKINNENGKVKKYQYEKDLFLKEIENFKYTIFQDSYGVLWFGTKEGLVYYEPEIDALILFKNNPFEKNSISNNEVRCIYEDSHKNLWIGTTHGFNKFNRDSQTFTRFFYPHKHDMQNAITGIVEGKSPHELWITSNNHGLYRFSVETSKFEAHTHSLTENSIATNNINCIIKDRSNIVWIGTRNGLNKLDIKAKKFNILSIPYGNNKEFNEHTTNIYLFDSLLFVGTRQDGLFIYNTHTQKTQNFSYTKGNFPGNHIVSIQLSSSGKLYVCGDSFCALYDKHTETFSMLHTIIPDMHEKLSGNRQIKALLEDSKGNIWIGTNSGIFMFDTEKKKLVNFDKYSNTRYLPSNIILSFFEDSKGTVWIGTDKGLARYTYDEQKIETYSYTKKNERHKSQNKVYCILEDTNSKMWIGTNSGLYAFREIDSLYEFYTEKNGLPNNQIFGLIANNQDIWISTNKGLAQFTQRTKTFKSFDPSDGIQGYEFVPNSMFKTNYGLVFFGGIHGVNVFYPDSIYDNPVVPNLETLHMSYFTDADRKIVYLSDAREVVLPWKHNFLTIHFASIEFTQPHKNKYKYILEDLDNEWHDLGSQNSINYSSLPSGNYTLKIIGSNNDGVWGHERILTIRVQTPIWKTTWAYIFYVIIFLILLFVFIESRTQKLRTANKTLIEKQKSAYEIAKQKEELSIKNKNITDSITYAKRIQWAIMPSRAKFKQLLPNSFILYMPKDIVSGDFYWITEIEDKIFIAAVDCTGHGVPGAFMSIIGYDLLRNITKERKIHKPSEILDYLNKALIELLTKNQMEDDTMVKDGMDIAICVMHKSKGIIEYAGALNPLYIVRNNKIISIKGDRFSVGLSNEHEDVPFKNHIIKVQPDDTFYIFSDGYADQFGGPMQKKMKYIRFRHLLLSIHHQPFIKQSKALKDYFVNWKGDTEQIDDILVIGFNVNNYMKSLHEKERDANL